MNDAVTCPLCQCDYCYADREIMVCPECANEWQPGEEVVTTSAVTDANGTQLANGDSVTVIKDLKVKGASQTLKVGTKVKNIRLLAADQIVDGHDIDCKIEGFGALKLKGSVVRKV